MLELFGVEMTNATEVCRTCGTADIVARLEVYMDAPGTVVRCAHCKAVLMRVVRSPERRLMRGDSLDYFDGEE